MDEGTEFLGELRFRDTLRIDGQLKGKIVSDNTLIVGETGHVEADIDCGVVSIRGTVPAGSTAASGSSSWPDPGSRPPSSRPSSSSRTGPSSRGTARWFRSATARPRPSARPRV